MPITLTTSKDGLTITGGGLEETFRSTGDGKDFELNAQNAERLSRTLLRFADEVSRRSLDPGQNDELLQPETARARGEKVVETGVQSVEPTKAFGGATDVATSVMDPDPPAEVQAAIQAQAPPPVDPPPDQPKDE